MEDIPLTLDKPDLFAARIRASRDVRWLPSPLPNNPTRVDEWVRARVHENGGNLQHLYALSDVGIDEQAAYFLVLFEVTPEFQGTHTANLPQWTVKRSSLDIARGVREGIEISQGLEVVEISALGSVFDWPYGQGSARYESASEDVTLHE